MSHKCKICKNEVKVLIGSPAGWICRACAKSHLGWKVAKKGKRMAHRCIYTDTVGNYLQDEVYK